MDLFETRSAFSSNSWHGGPRSSRVLRNCRIKIKSLGNQANQKLIPEHIKDLVGPCLYQLHIYICILFHRSYELVAVPLGKWWKMEENSPHTKKKTERKPYCLDLSSLKISKIPVNPAIPTHLGEKRSTNLSQYQYLRTHLGNRIHGLPLKTSMFFFPYSWSKQNKGHKHQT